MAQSKTKKQTSGAQPPRGAAAPPPPASVRIAISLAIAWHVFVVFISPLSVPPSSQLVVDIAQSRAVRWYTDQLYLNHGYHFFGPEPPVNHLVRYTVRDSGGATIAEGEFPNKKQQWPRLFYHRHMMLSDQANLAPSENGPEDAVRRSLTAYAHHLLRRHNGAEAQLDYVRHDPLLPMQVDADADANAPETFATVMSVRQTQSDLPAPAPETLSAGVEP